MTAEPMTWASIIKRGQQKFSASTNHGRAPPKQLYSPQAPPRSLAKATVPLRQDERLFLRLGKEHDWRQLSQTGIRESVAQHLGLPSDTIKHVYRVPTGFALKGKDEDTRQALIKLAEAFTVSWKQSWKKRLTWWSCGFP
ncbi:hypothetical protein K3495_g450 [Podosphaera aphanis]|nr:hypothetical protein K3495_g450 [Podosphaera aphanis]